MFEIVEGFLAPSSEGYIELSLENSCRRYYLSISNEKFCDYVVILADSAFHSNYVQLIFKDGKNKYAQIISYDYYENLNYQKPYEFENNRKFNHNDLEIDNFIICGFSGGGLNEFIVESENDEKEYYFKPEYPHYLNWVYMIACSFKNKTPLEITYRKESSSEYRASHEILNIKLEGIA